MTQSDHITITWNGHCIHAPCHVTYHPGGNYPHFWNLLPKLPIYFVTFWALWRRL